ncbi:sensor histidine kinase [Euzebya sp.]|uniref:sensor histidine kinase n=1 Tax=Euzebya sp. TaxID=1971409 RepID=UPI0035176399
MTDPTTTAAAVEDLDAIRRRVVNVVGHELRTPVTTIHGLAHAIAAAEDLATVTEELGPALLRNAERLTALLDDLLMASGITTAVPVGAPEPVAVHELLAERWAAMGDGELDVTGPSASALVPRAALVRAVDPVVANAAQYGSGAPHVEVAAADGEVRIAVRSPGPALHPEEVRLATEAFFRGERAVTTRPGLGVGLAVARTVAAQIGGRLSVAAADDGLVTTIELPAGEGG